MKRILLLSVILISSLISATSCMAQKAKKLDLPKLLQNQKLTPVNRTVAAIPGGTKPGVRVSEAHDEGVVWLTNETFSSGTIEVDLRGKDVLGKSFVGIAFHGQDDKTFDGIYFRPFNFLATDTMRSSHAVQYISHPAHPWDVLREQFPSKYENPVTPAPQPNDWFHVRLEVTEKDVTVFVNNNTKPSLRVQKLSKNTNGKIGLWVGNGSGGDFANLVIQ